MDIIRAAFWCFAIVLEQLPQIRPVFNVKIQFVGLSITKGNVLVIILQKYKEIYILGLQPIFATNKIFYLMFAGPREIA